jgi:hypothetical protein
MCSIHKVSTIVIVLVLAGCGNKTDPFKPAIKAECVEGFVNDTILPTGHDSDPFLTADQLTAENSSLWALWHIAQRDLSTEPIPYLDRHTIPPIPQAATEQPNCQRVVSVPDTLPRGGFTCDGTPAAGCFVNDTVFVANSVAFHSVWEMENAFLAKYGKVGGR